VVVLALAPWECNNKQKKSYLLTYYTISHSKLSHCSSHWRFRQRHLAGVNETQSLFKLIVLLLFGNVKNISIILNIWGLLIAMLVAARLFNIKGCSRARFPPHDAFSNLIWES
jgi:hypothetical protein